MIGDGHGPANMPKSVCIVGVHKDIIGTVVTFLHGQTDLELVIYERT